jgi:hypothetical protein
MNRTAKGSRKNAPRHPLPMRLQSAGHWRFKKMMRFQWVFLTLRLALRVERDWGRQELPTRMRAAAGLWRPPPARPHCTAADGPYSKERSLISKT